MGETRLDLLNYGISEGIIKEELFEEVMAQIAMARNSTYLKKHKYKIYEGKDGRWYTRLPLKEGGSKQKAFKSKKEAEEAVIEYYKNLEVKPTLKDLYDQNEKERFDRGKITSGTYVRNQSIFKRYYSEFGDSIVEELTVDDISEFIEDKVYKSSITPAEYRKIKGVLIGTLKYAKKKGLCNFTFEDVKPHLDINRKELKPNTSDDSKEVYDENETKKLRDFLSESDKVHDLALLFFFFTGLRIGELSALKWEDYDGERLNVHRMERMEYRLKGYSNYYEVLNDHTKTMSGMRVIPLPPGAITVLERLRTVNPAGEYIFEYEGNRITSYGIRKRLKRVCREVGVTYKPPHKIRKTFVTILLDGGMSPTLVSDIVGHKNASTTINYYKYKRASDETIRESYKLVGKELEI